MDRHLGGQFPFAAWFWPALTAAAVGDAVSSAAARFWDQDSYGTAQEPEGATPSRIALELRSVRLRDFTMANSGVPTLLCPPLALHGAAIADLAPGHSLVAALRGAGIGRLVMADWRSASPEMRYLGIDDYLADLNILVDELGGLVDLVGLCQGGWLSLVYAGRFPGKVRKLAMAGAPIDITARQSTLSAIAEATPMAVFQGLVDLGGGRVIGRDVASFWGNNATDANEIQRALQTLLPVGSEEFERLESSFRKWNSWTLNIPGRYYLEVIEKLYKRNELARGRFVALGQTIDLSRVRLPIYLLAGSDDDVVAPEQLLAMERLAGTRPEGCEVASCNHLGLFMGKAILEEYWPRIARWMQEPFLERNRARL